jgi:hypothetical protein
VSPALIANTVIGGPIQSVIRHTAKPAWRMRGAQKVPRDLKVNSDRKAKSVWNVIECKEPPPNFSQPTYETETQHPCLHYLLALCACIVRLHDPFPG